MEGIFVEIDRGGSGVLTSGKSVFPFLPFRVCSKK